MGAAASRTVKLREPVELGEDKVVELTFRKPQAGDMRRFPAGPGATIGDYLDLASSLSGQPKAVIDRLSIADMQDVVELIDGFGQGGRGTGTAPSPS
jgi:hypothetical protein